MTTEYRRTDKQLHFFYNPALPNGAHVPILLCASWGLWQQNNPMEFRQHREVVATSQQRGWRETK